MRQWPFPRQPLRHQHLGVLTMASSYLRVCNFLPSDLADEMFADLLRQRDGFRIRRFKTASGIGTFYRMGNPITPHPVFVQQLRAAFVEVERLFALNLAEPEIELLAQAYNDGSAFGLHSDVAAGGPNWKRRVSAVFYLHKRPRRFSGGELAIHNKSGSAHLVGADHNSIVIFARDALHEVLQVSCPSKRFEDSRFAVNVWVS
jgi:2OG-Fe(II) oxygenase superfamily